MKSLICVVVFAAAIWCASSVEAQCVGGVCRIAPRAAVVRTVVRTRVRTVLTRRPLRVFARRGCFRLFRR
jgi:hypothetical protein